MHVVDKIQNSELRFHLNCNIDSLQIRMRGLMFKLLTSGLICFAIASSAQNMEWSPNSRPSFRPRMFEKEIYLQPLEKNIDTSVGIRISTHNVEEFSASLHSILETRGPQALRNSKIYMLGIEMGQEKLFQQKYQTLLKQEPFQNLNIKLIILSVPPQKIFEMSQNLAGNIIKKMKYFLPSFARDYQTPTWGEVTSGMNTNITIEFFTVSYLFSELPVLDASLASIAHAALVGSMVIYQKSLYNWINRPGTSNKEIFLKQTLLSMPFILNFNVFGNFSKITNHIQQFGFDSALTQLPHEIATFASTQGFTLFLQTAFYYTLMSKGLRNWANNQTGSENARIARTMVNYNALPFLAFDAVFLAMASTNNHPLYNFGYFNLNAGHLALAGLTLLSSAFWAYPQLLDPTIRWYRSYENLKSKYFHKKTKQCAAYFM